MSFTVQAYAAPSPKAKLEKVEIKRRVPGKNDVQFDILYCGICHSDLHQLRQEWKNYRKASNFPMVAGHEFVGRVTKVGENVTHVKVGDLVGVGCMVDSCRQCGACHDKKEMFCRSCVYTYGSTEPVIGGTTHGGYSRQMVCDKDFTIRIPDTFADKLPGVASLFCAGITTYSPLRKYGAGPGKKVGVVGLGG
uniref:NADP-dependent alcohol dehydrogenase C 2 n=2 Tax=Lygus hesperus TaxID=30085 RepID=A0A0A9Y7Y6_LYGHE